MNMKLNSGFKMCVLLVGLTSSFACSQNSNKKWVYYFDGHVTNLLGFGEEGRRWKAITWEEENAFLGTRITILKQDNSTLAVACNSHVSGTLLLLLKLPHDSSRSWSINTDTGTLRAWLIRPSAETIRNWEQGSGEAWLQDEKLLKTLIDSPDKLAKAANVIPFDGTAEIELRPQGFRKLLVDIRSSELMPPHREFARNYMVWPPSVFASQRRLMNSAASAPCHIRGTFWGGFFYHPIPL